MKFLLYLHFLSLFFTDWLAFKLHLVPRQVTWIPEICSLLIFSYILFQWAYKKKINISFWYLFLIFFFILSIIIGFLFNKVRLGVMFSGLRIYFRFFPFFLLPAVYDFNEKEISNFLKFTLILFLLQCPVVLYQRFIKYSSSLSGDPMGGTLGENTSGVLSICIICAISFLNAFYLKNKIRFKNYLILFFILILPTSLNETKVTFFLLPIIFLLPLFFKNTCKNYKTIFILFFISGAGIILIKTIYDIFAKRRWGYGFITFLTMTSLFEEYLSRRLEPLIITLKMARENITFFFFGYGAGNASYRFSPLFTGDYASKLDKLGKIKLGFVTGMWEIGILGMFIFFIMLFLILRDSIYLNKIENYYSTIGFGMIGTTIIYIISFIYFPTFEVLIFNSLFWFFAGLVANKVYLQKNFEN